MVLPQRTGGQPSPQPASVARWTSWTAANCIGIASATFRLYSIDGRRRQENSLWHANHLRGLPVNSSVTTLLYHRSGPPREHRCSSASPTCHDLQGFAFAFPFKLHRTLVRAGSLRMHMPGVWRTSRAVPGRPMRAPRTDGPRRIHESRAYPPTCRF